MIRIDSKNRTVFKKYFEGENIIEESNTKLTRFSKAIRKLFQIFETNKLKTYINLGDFNLDNEKSTSLK
ncbi:MAG: hypothetical protein GX638_17485 [Crenarchaeota archaeon]|nr:hypothetical protein [Thermoproteota archaeon]